MRLLFKDENSKEQEVEEGVVRSAEDVVRLSPSLTSTTTVVKVLVRGGNNEESTVVTLQVGILCNCFVFTLFSVCY